MTQIKQLPFRDLRVVVFVFKENGHSSFLFKIG